MIGPLPLDSPLWGKLNHAYGPAEDVPDLLEELSAKESLVGSADEEPMFRLWSSLYHQGAVYSGSYAAFPHLVRIAESKDLHSRGEILQLAAAIASGHDDPERLLIPETSNAYFESRNIALALILETFRDHDCANGFQFWLGSIAALKGKAATARLLFSLDSFVDSYLTKDLTFPISDQMLDEIRS